MKTRNDISWILVAYIIGFCFGCRPSASTIARTENIKLKAGEYMSISLDLAAGDLVEGSFAVRGPEKFDIKFAVQDPSGKNVFGPVKLRSGTFAYRVRTAGAYCLFIDNSYSISNGKIVSLTYTRPRR
jgi:hypothetical protein